MEALVSVGGAPLAPGSTWEGAPHLALVFLLPLFVSRPGSSQVPPEDPTEHCQSEYFQPNCGMDEVILMDMARYGRMRVGRCVKKNFGYIGCATDVLDYVDSLCSGRRSCKVQVLDGTFNGVKPCHDDLKSHLEATHHCIPVVTDPRHTCRSYKPITTTKSSGFLASLIAEETGCGSADAPWIIRVAQGQRINITMYDFALKSNATTEAPPPATPDSKVCRVYATLRESTSTRSVTVCGGSTRTRSVYVSSTNQVEMRILNSKTPHKPVYFLFKYEAMGCPRVHAPPNGWVEHEEDTNAAIVGCDSNKQSFRLVCEGVKWKGMWPNCTTTSSSAEPMAEEVMFGFMSLSLEVSIIIIVVLALAIGLLILIFGVFCLRRPSVFMIFNRQHHMDRHRRTPMETAVELSDDGLREHHEVKATPQTTVGFPSPVLISCPRDAAFKENEYASMRLLPPIPDMLYDQENTNNQSRDHHLSREFIFESPQEGRHFCPTCDTCAAGEASCVHVPCSEYGPHYFDLDPETLQRMRHSHVIHGTLPTVRATTATAPNGRLPSGSGVQVTRNSGNEFKVHFAEAPRSTGSTDTLDRTNSNNSGKRST